MPNTKQEIADLDGMEDIDCSLTKIRFSDDIRVMEARKMLASSKPVLINLTQRPDVSDHDFIEEQEKHLYGICIRTMALPVGSLIVGYPFGYTSPYGSSDCSNLWDDILIRLRERKCCNNLIESFGV